jgi:alpha-methylacyl-CoA racemase
MGPLTGYRIVEFAGIGPGPMGAMLLADLGATVLRLVRPDKVQMGSEKVPGFDLTCRNRQLLTVDLKSKQGVELALDLIDKADGVIEGFRPGVMERIGLGPDICLARNPRLVYARTTGWGQDGPLADAAGHDLNYIALSGALHAIGREGGPPVPPLNLVGDFGGGALYLAFGLVCGLLEAKSSGRGQVVDIAMVDGALSLMTAFYGSHASGRFTTERGTNVVDGGAPFYDVYACADGHYISIAPIEDRFRAVLYERIGLDPAALIGHDGPAQRHEVKPKLAALFKTRTRDAWCELLEGTDACFAPVLSVAEAPDHAHLQARGAIIEVDGIKQPAPAPRFSRTPAALPRPPHRTPQSGEAVLPDWGIDSASVKALREAGVIS